MYSWYHCAPTTFLNYRDNSVIFMFIWYYYLHVVLYVSVTIVKMCDVIIKFYTINMCYWDPTQSKRWKRKEENTPVQ